MSRTTTGRMCEWYSNTPHVKTTGMMQEVVHGDVSRMVMMLARVLGIFLSWKFFLEFFRVCNFLVRTIFVLGILNLKIISQ